MLNRPEFYPAQERAEMDRWLVEKLKKLNECYDEGRDRRWVKDYDGLLDDMENFIEFLGGRAELKSGITFEKLIDRSNQILARP